MQATLEARRTLSEQTHTWFHTARANKKMSTGIPAAGAAAHVECLFLVLFERASPHASFVKAVIIHLIVV